VRTIGLIGGMSWESTVPYYREINRYVARRLGGFHSARLVLWSVDFHELEAAATDGRWDDVGRDLADAARRLEAAGAEILVLCTNTMHRVADAIEAATELPLVHIADAVAADVKQAGLRTVGLLGTRFTMEQDFYRDRLAVRHGLEVLVPPPDDRTLVDRTIFEELVHGEFRDAARASFRAVIAGLVERGAEGVILGCTEIGMLVGPDDAAVLLFDSATIHARAAAELALETAARAPAG
jgi:aspartate racemase